MLDSLGALVHLRRLFNANVQTKQRGLRALRCRQHDGRLDWTGNPPRSMLMARISPMVRTALFVSDLERSARFYREVLGLTEIFFEGELTDGNAHELLGVPPGSHTQAVILKAPGPAWGMVGLFEVSEPSPPRLSRRAETINVGEGCLVFYCSDLTPVVRKLEAGGQQIIRRPVQLRIGNMIKQREMCFRDPDGVLINLIEWDPDAAVRPEQT